MKVSVIISTYTKDRLPQVLDCIRSLRCQSLAPEEILLVLDPDQSLIETYEASLPNYVKTVVSGGYGLSNARNSGIKDAHGEIVAFIDDDAVADENWLGNLVENYGNPEVVGVGGAIRPLWENRRPAWFPEELDWTVGCSYKGLPEHRANVRNPIDCNMSFRKSVFDKVGYFRPDIGRFGKVLLAGEEPELSLRILEKMPRSQIVYEPSAVVYHRVDERRTRLSYLWKRSFYEGVSKALIANAKRNPEASLSSEDRYLKYLLRNAIPSRLRRIYQPKSVCQLLVLFFSLCAVFAGFFSGSIRGGK